MFKKSKFQLWVLILSVSPCLTRGPGKISMFYTALGSKGFPLAKRKPADHVGVSRLISTFLRQSLKVGMVEKSS